MRILVYDDSEINRAAAQAQLKCHDLTVVGTYDEAEKLLTPKLDLWKLDYGSLKSRFGDFNPYLSDDKVKVDEYKAAEALLKHQATTYPNFDAVLCDLLVPASGNHLNPESQKIYANKEMPVGIFIGLIAAVKARAKYVAVFTDTDHHAHPASACFDIFNLAENVPTAFTVAGSKFLLSNTRDWISQFDPEDLSKELYPGWDQRAETVRAKNWAALLEYLTST